MRLGALVPVVAGFLTCALQPRAQPVGPSEFAELARELEVELELGPAATAHAGTWLLTPDAGAVEVAAALLEHLQTGGRLVIAIAPGAASRRATDALLARLQVSIRAGDQAPSRDEYRVTQPFVGLPGLQPIRGGRGAWTLDVRPPARSLLGPRPDQAVLAVCRPAASKRSFPGGEVFVLSDPALLSLERAVAEPTRSLLRSLLGWKRLEVTGPTASAASENVGGD